MRVPLTVVIDTNFIAVPAQFGVDIFSEAERVLERKLEFEILSSSLDELDQKLKDTKNKTEVRHFRIAKELAKRCKTVEPLEDTLELPVDDQILLYTELINGVLATNDRELRSHARAKGIPVLILRSMKYLVLEGHVN
jgi:rRNA-processing protein FCF1